MVTDCQRDLLNPGCRELRVRCQHIVPDMLNRRVNSRFFKQAVRRQVELKTTSGCSEAPGAGLSQGLGTTAFTGFENALCTPLLFTAVIT
jgi:hypothetical protein